MRPLCVVLLLCLHPTLALAKRRTTADAAPAKVDTPPATSNPQLQQAVATPKDESSHDVEAVTTETDDENPLEGPKPRKSSDRTRYFVGLALGSGTGYAKGDGLESYDKEVSGFTPGRASGGLGHFMFELGLKLSDPRWSVSVQTRHQYIAQQNDRMAGGANSALLKLMRTYGEQTLRGHTWLGAGGGDGVRLVVQARRTSGEVVTDTVRGGPGLAAAGGGMTVAFSRTYFAIMEVSVLAGVPAFSLAVDVNAGLRAAF